MLVAVYGTLKQGYNNHYILEGKPLVGQGLTKKHLTMIDSGFPVLVDRSAAKKKQYRVQVEVYDIGDDSICLNRLDALEGEGRMYHRRVTEVVLSDGRTVECSIYIGAEYWLERYYARSTRDFLRLIEGEEVLVWPTIHREQMMRWRTSTRSLQAGEQEDTCG